MICPHCEAENAFAAARCADCGKPIGPARESASRVAAPAADAKPAARSTSRSPFDQIGQPENLGWLGPWAIWGMPVTYLVLIAAAAFGLKLPMLVMKVILGGGALAPLRALLKKDPHNARALAARQFGRIQMGVMLAAELGTIPFAFFLPAESVLLVGGIILIVALAVHIVVGIVGTRRLRSIARNAVHGVAAQAAMN